MASAKPDLTCPVCLEIFKNPVVLSCSHSLCKDCLESWWEKNQKRIKIETQTCPVCKRRSSKEEPPYNLALKNLCEAFLQDFTVEDKSSVQSASLCSLHSEKLKLFCLDHQQPVCVVCRDSKTHTNHRFRPIDEAAQEYRETFNKSLETLQEKLEQFNQAKISWDQAAKHIKVQAQQTERQIKNEFKKLRDFLQQEEEARITALRTEEKQKSRVMREEIDALNENIKALSEKIKTAEKELKSENISFLQTYKDAVVRLQCTPPAPQLCSGALIDVAKHVGNLGFNIWNKIKNKVSYSPVILDPNTAPNNLLLSDNLTSVRFTEETQTQQLTNPERIENYFSVLGSTGFTSGTHSWEVEVNNDTFWAVGVMGESAPRKGEILSLSWIIWFSDGKYVAYSPPDTGIVLSVKSPIQRIKVHLDLIKGKLSFSDPDTNTNIYTFSQTFTERMFPYINTKSTKPLKIVPVSVTLQFKT